MRCAQVDEKVPKKLYRDRAIWRDQLFRDKSLTSSTFRYGYGVAECITRTRTIEVWKKTNEIDIWPSQAKFGAFGNVGRRTAVAATKQLIDHGHWELIQRGNQTLGGSVYRIIIWDVAWDFVWNDHDHIGRWKWKNN